MAKYCIIGEEVGASKTPHLQGFISLQTRSSFHQVKTLLGTRCHIEMARGTDAQNQSYCTKDGHTFLELGEPMVGTTHRGGGSNQAAAAIRAASKLARGKTPADLATTSPEQFSAWLCKRQAVESLADDYRTRAAKAVLHQTHGDTKLRTWQRDLWQELATVPDERTVHWFHDESGNAGKTWFSKLVLSVSDCVRFENGKSCDVKHAYAGERVVFFDLSRSQSEHVNYEVIESIKNGVMFSSKYDSRQKLFPPPHVIVFANFAPDFTKLSQDRWKFTNQLDCSVTLDSVNTLMTKVKVEKEKDVIIINDDDDDVTVADQPQSPAVSIASVHSEVIDLLNDETFEPDSLPNITDSEWIDAANEFIDENGGGQPTDLDDQLRSIIRRKRQCTQSPDLFVHDSDSESGLSDLCFE